MDRGGSRRLVAVVAVIAALLVACGGGTGTPSVAPSVAPSVSPSSRSSPSTIPSPSPAELALGVTPAPCPGATTDDRGCIRLGALADISEGPFAALGASILRGAQAFWQRVDAAGGIGGRFDVDVETFVRDTRFDPSAHAAAAAEIAPDVLAIALSLGTEQTLAALAVLDTDELLIVPASLWSGWAFEPQVVASGYSYCLESIGGLDWFAAERGAITGVVSVHHGDLYGRDSRAGVARWSALNDVAFDPGQHVIVTPRTTSEVTQDDTVAALIEVAPAVVVLATGPVEAAEIVTKAHAEGFEGRFLGSVPTWNPALLETRAADALREIYDVVLPWQPWGGDSEAHVAMQRALDEGVPSNEGFVFGWMTQYPLLHALEAAVAADEVPDRAALREALSGLRVTFDGAAPPRTYRGAGADIQRRVTVAQPDEGATLGTVVSVEGYLGETAAAVDIEAPCAAA